MARRFESPIGTLAWWLLALNCVGVIQVAHCDWSNCQGIFNILNDRNLRLADVEKILTDYKSSEVAGISVVKLLKFKSDSCEVEGLAELDFLTQRSTDPCAWNKNYGVSLFVNHYRERRIRVCRAIILPKFKESMLCLHRNDKQTLREFYHEWNKKDSGSWKTYFERILPKSASKKLLDKARKLLNNTFDVCFHLVRRQRTYMPYDKLIPVYITDQDEFSTCIYMQPCKTYLDLACDRIKDLYPETQYGGWYAYNADCENFEKWKPLLEPTVAYSPK